jgi:hypothetical protein
VICRNEGFAATKHTRDERFKDKRETGHWTQSGLTIAGSTSCLRDFDSVPLRQLSPESVHTDEPA